MTASQALTAGWLILGCIKAAAALSHRRQLFLVDAGWSHLSLSPSLAPVLYFIYAVGRKSGAERGLGLRTGDSFTSCGDDAVRTDPRRLCPLVFIPRLKGGLRYNKVNNQRQ
ncbi:hypothetical protein JOB18_043584 [Solea senegalensis]|uniref:Secreted protein n=1 Tax=Solea senegalensis TaxID=28829 RepID=A0AAV6R7S7_SOLSE|nr:hypothetical protein JOB18_043584 [Solea senegalensis]